MGSLDSEDGDADRNLRRSGRGFGTTSTAALVGNGGLLPTTGANPAGMVLAGPGGGYAVASLKVGPGCPVWGG
jgi:hypothetical protein